MFSNPLITLAADHHMTEGLQLTVVGMGVVFFGLIAIWVMTTVLNKMTQEPEKAPAPAPAPTPAASTNPDEISPETFAIITAAVMTVVRKPIRIERVRFVSQQNSGAWAEHGREAIHGSHRIRKG